MKKVTKKLLAGKLTGRGMGASKSKSKFLVDQFFSALSQQVIGCKKLMISRFGTFRTTVKASRRERNPQTGESMTIEERTVITFSAASVLRQSMVEGEWVGSGGPSAAMLLVADNQSKPEENQQSNAAIIILREIAQALVNGDGVEIRGFGSFSVRNYDGYTGRNPSTGEAIKVEPKRLPFFKPSRLLLARINR